MSSRSRSMTGAGTLADSVAIVRPALPDCLVPETVAERVMTVAAMLPAALATGFGFECHLGAQPHADLLVRVRAAEAGRSVLAGTSTLGSLPAHLDDEPAWAGLRAFARGWGDPSVDPVANTGNVWLEFDIDPDGGGGARMPVPSVFFSAHHGVPSRLLGTHVPPAAFDAYGWVTREGLPTVLGRPLAPGTEELVVAALDGLPSGANAFQFGVMLARPLDAVRLCIAQLPPDAVVDYLTRLGWDGDPCDLQALVGQLATLVDHVVLAIDIADRVSPRIGFECYFADFRQPGEEPRWRALLDELVARELCGEAQREALLGYPGFVPQGQAAGAWPGHLAAAASLLGPRATSGMVRMLHHVKVAYRPGHPLEAKAYLGATHHWLVGGRAAE